MIRRYFIFLFLVIFSKVFSQKNPYRQYKQEEYDLGIDLFNKKLYKSASNIFYELSQDINFKKNRRDIKCKYYYILCEIYTGQKNTDKLLDQFLVENKNEIDANETYYQVAKFFFDNLDFKNAQLWYEKIDRFSLLKEREDDYFFEIGFSQYKNKDYYKAKPNLFFSTKTQKYKIDAIYYYSHIAYEEDMFSTALEGFPKIKKEKKYLGIVPKYEVQMLFLHRRYAEAINLGEDIIKDTTLEKNDKDAYIELCKILGDCYFEIGNYENVIKYYEKTKKESKLTNEEYYKIGYSYYIKENYDKSIDNLNKIISENSNMGQNAYYYLSDSYLKKGKKVEAFNSFKNTSELDFDTIIKKDAFFNYAKMSYDIGNPYENTIEIITMYLAKYPDDINSRQLKKLLASAYVLDERYDEAIEYTQKNKEESHEISNLIQYISFKKAMEYIKLGKYEDAIIYLDKSIEIGYEIDIKNRSSFWKGECNYKLDNINESILDFKEYMLSENINKYYETSFLDYNLGYIYFNKKDYIQSLEYFIKYEQKNKNLVKVDVFLRIADCYFALSEMKKAIYYYKLFLDKEKNRYNDYAHFNVAICLGIEGNYDDKIEKLNFLLNNFKNSSLIDHIIYELAITFLRKENYDKAIFYFEKLEKEYPYSEKVIESKQKRALIYYNKNNLDKSINIYKEIVQEYPNSVYSKQAIGNLKKIYIEQGNIDSYVNYTENIDFIDFTHEELDSLAFFDVESLYMEKKYNLAEPKLLDYKKRFPKGIFINDATFYLAETFFNQNKEDESIKFYKEVLTFNNTNLVIESLKKLIDIYARKKDDNHLIEYMDKLSKIDRSIETILYSNIELSKAYYRIKNFDKSYEYSKISLEAELNIEEKNTLSFILARSSLKLNKLEDAEKQYLYLENNSVGEDKAESMYYVSYFLFQKKEYDKVIDKVSQMGEEVSEYKFWGGKALILMAKSFYNLNDEYQANYITESVISNIFYEEVQNEAKKFLEDLKKENNNSIKKENIQENE